MSHTIKLSDLQPTPEPPPGQQTGLAAVMSGNGKGYVERIHAQQPGERSRNRLSREEREERRKYGG